MDDARARDDDGEVAGEGGRWERRRGAMGEGQRWCECRAPGRRRGDGGRRWTVARYGSRPGSMHAARTTLVGMATARVAVNDEAAADG